MTKIYAELNELLNYQFLGKGFSLNPKQPVSSLLSGKYGSRLRGRGLTFEELRDYRSGDDIRAIDWKATARLRRPQVRVYTEDRERPVLILVDQRVSMFFGSARTTKATCAAECAAVAAWRAIDAGNKVGSIIFADEDVTEIRPHRSRRNVMTICQALVEANQKLSSKATINQSETLNETLLRAANVAKHDYLVLLITDFVDADEQTKELTTRLAMHNDLIAVLVYDPIGGELHPTSDLAVTDGKSQHQIKTTGNFPSRYKSEFERLCRSIQDTLSGIRVPILPICTHDEVVGQIAIALGARQ